MQDIVDVLVYVGDFEGAIVTEDMLKLNQQDYQFLVGKYGITQKGLEEAAKGKE